MNKNIKQIETDKISNEFSAKLSQLSENEEICAIVVVKTEISSGPMARRELRSKRREKIMEVKNSAKKALDEIDKILTKLGGKRLSNDVNSLGCITVKTTADGILSLASSTHVKSIMEDQQVSLIR